MDNQNYWNGEERRKQNKELEAENAQLNTALLRQRQQLEDYAHANIADRTKVAQLNKEVVKLREELAASRKTAWNAAMDRAAEIARTPVAGEQDDITMEAKDRIAEAIEQEKCE